MINTYGLLPEVKSILKFTLTSKTTDASFNYLPTNYFSL